MAVQTESNRLGDIVKWEEDNHFSRDPVVVASGENLPIGTIVGKVTATGKMVELDPIATDGSEEAAGFLIADCDASAADVNAVIIAREAIVVSSGLVWNVAVTDPEKVIALAELKALGIIVRDEG